MRALIRNKGETILESYDLAFINWDTGAPLTNEEWSGGAYTLVEDYDPENDVGVATSDEGVEFYLSPRGSGEAEFMNETVTIDGKEYTREELLAILNQTH